MSLSPIALIRLPHRVRLGIVMASFVVSLIIYAFIFPTTQNGTIIVIPVILAGWLFGRRGALVCALVIDVLAMGMTCLILKTIFWPSSLVTTTLIGSIALFLIGLVIGYLRYTFSVAEISRRKALESERQRAIAYEQRLEALQKSQQMSLAYEHERQLNSLKDQFIVNVNHEFRTPLSEVHGYLELLVDHYQELNDELRTTFLSNASNGCRELILLVNTVLDSIQVSNDAKPPSLEEVSVVRVVDEVLALFEPRTRAEYQMHVVIAESLTVWADQQFLRQVLRNLLSNAFKYAPKQTSITISAQRDENATEQAAESSQVCISVKDEGPGIPPNEARLLFGKFVRLQRDLSGSIRGTGLGLYMSKRLVESMQGRIWVESSGREGEGSKFCLTLPTAPTHSTAAEEGIVRDNASLPEADTDSQRNEQFHNSDVQFRQWVPDERMRLS
jgi:signal transduction histidine kinase